MHKVKNKNYVKKQVTYKKLKILTFRSAHNQQLIIIIVVSGAVSIANKIIFKFNCDEAIAEQTTSLYLD
jgi:hypothetical protein